MKNCALLFLFFLFVACSSNSTESEFSNKPKDKEVIDGGSESPGQPEESQTEDFSFSIHVNGEYFNDSFKGKIFLSNEHGEILAEKELNNNSENSIALEVQSNSNYDITFLTRKSTQFNANIDIHTFTNISSGDYFLEAIPKNGNEDSFTLYMTNTGFDIESVNLDGVGSSQTSGNGGTFEQDFKLNNYPGNLFAAFVSPNESVPRYFYGSEIERNTTVERDYSNLPFFENQISVDLSSNNINGIALYGFNTQNGIREKQPIYIPDAFLDGLIYTPDGIFDNFELNLFINCCNFSRSYKISHYGEPTSQTFDYPSFDAILIDSNMDNFVLGSMSEHDYSTIVFVKPYGNIYDNTYNFNIYSIGQNSLSLSKGILFDNIFRNGEIQGSEMNFARVILTKNNSLSNDYAQFLQSTIENRAEYPTGTKIETCSFRF